MQATHLLLPIQDANTLLEYLSNKPFREVAGFIQQIQNLQGWTEEKAPVGPDEGLPKPDKVG